MRLKDKLKDVDFGYQELNDKVVTVLEFTDGKILSPYRSESVDALWSLEDIGYKPLAWTPNVRYLLYNKEDNVILQDVEGDIYFYFNPSKEKIDELLQEYPKAEVCECCGHEELNEVDSLYGIFNDNFKEAIKDYFGYDDVEIIERPF